MTKDREDRKKEKKEKKERKEKKRREAEELEAREKKISKKKHKSESKKAEEKSAKSKKKPKKLESESESESEVEEKTPKKSKESKKKKHKKSDESEEPQTKNVHSRPVTVPIATTNNESDSDFESDKEDIKHLLESYSKEELINLIYKTAEKGSRLVSAVLESADRDTAQRNIFVRGLGWDTTHENLKAAFEVYGEIDECSVVMDKDTGRAKGYGFVMFKTRKGAREALRNPEKRMYNRNVSCNLAQAKPSGAGKPREPVESVKIDLTQTANQSEMALPRNDLAHVHGVDKGQQQQQNMAMYAAQNMPFYGLSQPPIFNPMYGAMMGNQGAIMGNQGAMIGNQMAAGLPNYHMFGSGMMNQGPMVPPNHMGMMGQYVGDGNGNVNGNGNGNGNVNGNGVGPAFDGERAWYLR